MTTAMGLLGWLCDCVALHWLLIDLGTDVTLHQSIFVFAFAMLVGAVSMLSGGLGGTEATMVGLLTLLEVAAGMALAAMLIIRLTTLWFAVALGFAALPAALRLVRRQCVGDLSTETVR
jgi:uncharacterized protein (TIRG00374 family)